MFTLDQIRHVAETAIHTQYLSVRLMGCPLEDRLPAACLALEFFHGDAAKGKLATPENAQRLLSEVAEHFEPYWHALQARRCEPDSPNADALAKIYLQALDDLTKTNWANKVLCPLFQGRRKESELAATEYLRLREGVLGWTRLRPVANLTGSDFCAFLRKGLRPHIRGQTGL